MLLLMKRVIMIKLTIIVMILLLLMINITFCSQEWDDSALWLKAGSWKLWIWNPVTEVSVSLLYLLCSNPETCYAIILIKSANNFVTARKKDSNFASFNLKSVDEIFSMETQSSTALSCGTVLIIMLHKMFFDWNLGVWPFKWKLPSSTFLWYLSLCCVRWL